MSLTPGPMPLPSPEACLEAAHKHQEEYERLKRLAPPTRADLSPSAQRMEMFYHGGMAENNALLACAGFLQRIVEQQEQMHICDHGTRGWCPDCFIVLRDVR